MREEADDCFFLLLCCCCCCRVGATREDSRFPRETFSLFPSFFLFQMTWMRKRTALSLAPQTERGLVKSASLFFKICIPIRQKWRTIQLLSQLILMWNQTFISLQSRSLSGEHQNKIQVLLYCTSSSWLYPPSSRNASMLVPLLCVRCSSTLYPHFRGGETRHFLGDFTMWIFPGRKNKQNVQRLKGTYLVPYIIRSIIRTILVSYETTYDMISSTTMWYIDKCIILEHPRTLLRPINTRFTEKSNGNKP